MNDDLNIMQHGEHLAIPDLEDEILDLMETEDELRASGRPTVANEIAMEAQILEAILIHRTQ